jgi:hypothetical protein
LLTSSQEAFSETYHRNVSREEKGLAPNREHRRNPRTSNHSRDMSIKNAVDGPLATALSVHNNRFLFARRNKRLRIGLKTELWLREKDGKTLEWYARLDEEIVLSNREVYKANAAQLEFSDSEGGRETKEEAMERGKHEERYVVEEDEDEGKDEDEGG